MRLVLFEVVVLKHSETADTKVIVPPVCILAANGEAAKLTVATNMNFPKERLNTGEVEVLCRPCC